MKFNIISRPLHNLCLTFKQRLHKNVNVVNCIFKLQKLFLVYKVKRVFVEYAFYILSNTINRTELSSYDLLKIVNAIQPVICTCLTMYKVFINDE